MNSSLCLRTSADMQSVSLPRSRHRNLYGNGALIVLPIDWIYGIIYHKLKWTRTNSIEAGAIDYGVGVTDHARACNRNVAASPPK